MSYYLNKDLGIHALLHVSVRKDSSVVTVITNVIKDILGYVYCMHRRK